MAEPRAGGVQRASEPSHAAVPPDFQQFYDAEHGRLFGALCLVTGNRHDAEELMQEAFLKVWERWDVVQGMESPVGYLYRTAMNAFRMRFRRAKIAARRVAARSRGPIRWTCSRPGSSLTEASRRSRTVSVRRWC